MKNYTTTSGDPTEWNGKESESCVNCQIDLTYEEIQEELKNCFSCTEEIEQAKQLSPERKELLKRFLKFPTLEK